MQLTLQYNKPGTRSSSSVGIDPGYLADLVASLSFPRPFGTPENDRAEKLVADEFSKTFGSCFRVGQTRNLCFGSPQDTRILIGAHFDSVPGTPGADDNASAVAVMLAVAKVLGPRRDIMYVAFNAEECDLAGSREFVKEVTGQMKKLEQIHVLEMVGYGTAAPTPRRTLCP